MKKVLFCASAASHITNFHLPYVEYLKKLGYEVHTATKGNVDHQNIAKSYNLPFSKKIYSIKNFKAMFELKKILKTQKYNLISTHAMLAGAVGRMAIKLSKCNKTKVLHTSHGYLFEDNGSIKSRLIISLEKYLAKYTDELLVMNQNDLNVSKKYKLANTITFINGMGVDRAKFKAISYEQKQLLLKKLSINQTDFIFLYAGEFSKRKNQSMLINAFKKVSDTFPKAKLLLLGDGQLLEKCKQQAKKLGLNNHIIFTGYINNMNDYYQIADVVVSTSKSEGLPFNIMEAQLYNIPIIASIAKGHTDLITQNETGFLFDLNDNNMLGQHMINLATNKDLYKKLKQQTKLSKQNDINNVRPLIEKIYSQLLQE